MKVVTRIVAVSFRGLAALVTIVSLYVATAHAAPQRVAIVNIAADQVKGAELASALREQLRRESTLRAIPMGDLSRALEAPLPPPQPTEEALRQPRESLARSKDARARFDFPGAFTALRNGQRALLALPPSSAVTALMAELEFEAGLAHFGAGDLAAALEAFRAVRRLHPDRAALDPARFLPDIVATFEAAGVELEPSAVLSVSSQIDGEAVYLDGRLAGTTPAELPVAPGIHYVTVRSDDYRVIGSRVVLEAAAKREAELGFERLEVDERARAARAAMIPASAAERLTRAAGRLASLVGADALILVAGDDSLRTALFSGRQNRLSGWRPASGVAASHLLAPLRPATMTTLALPDAIEVQPAPRPWYRRRWVQATAAGGVVVALLTAAAFGLSAKRDEMAVPTFDPF